MDISTFLTKNKNTITIVVFIIIGAAVVYFFTQYSGNQEGMTDLSFSPLASQPSDVGYFDHPTPEDIQGQYAYPVTSDTDINPVNFKLNQGELTPYELLPTSESHGVGGEFSDTDLSSKNFLVSGFNIGINSQGNTNKNANRQVRSDPVIPQNLNATPFGQSTLGPDITRKQFEIGGSGC